MDNVKLVPLQLPQTIYHLALDGAGGFLDEGPSCSGEGDGDYPSVRRIPASRNVALAFEPVDHAGDRAGVEVHLLAQLTEGQDVVFGDGFEGPELGSGDAELAPDRGRADATAARTTISRMFDDQRQLRREEAGVIGDQRDQDRGDERAADRAEAADDDDDEAQHQELAADRRVHLAAIERHHHAAESRRAPSRP